ncbi:MAG: EutN/CcmL family microcompartment protein [Gemmatimonadota bacterium]
MILARVAGTVTSTDKDAELASYKLLVVQPLALDGADDGPEEIAIDQVDAGIGDRVLVMREGGSARLVTGRDRLPLQNIVIGVVDDVHWLAGYEPAAPPPAGNAAPA